jgi:hypothetical protein
LRIKKIAMLYLVSKFFNFLVGTSSVSWTRLAASSDHYGPRQFPLAESVAIKRPVRIGGQLKTGKSRLLGEARDVASRPLRNLLIDESDHESLPASEGVANCSARALA